MPSDECPAGTGEDTILLPGGIYRRTRAGSPEELAVSGGLAIREDLLIRGAGGDVPIIDGTGIDRVIDVDPGEVQILVVLQGLTIWGGHAPEGFVFGDGLESGDAAAWS